MGAEDAYLLSAREFGGSDTYATATIIANALKKISFDLVVTGRQAIDGDTAQVGPQIAEQLKIPQVSYAQELDIVNGEVIVNRQYEDQFHILKVQLPCLVTALAELSEPRYMHAGGIVDAYNKEVKVWGFDDLKNDLNPEWIGLKGSPTNVFQSFGKKPKTPGTIYDGLSVEEAVEKIMAMLIERHII
jgi:electron transfer flavoprotein beta subunit